MKAKQGTLLGKNTGKLAGGAKLLDGTYITVGDWITCQIQATPNGINKNLGIKVGKKYKIKALWEEDEIAWVKLLGVDGAFWLSNFDDLENPVVDLVYNIQAKNGANIEVGFGNENALMVMNNNKQIKHHTEELNNVVNSDTEVPAWVVAKVNRSASDLSDATHYLDGVNSKFAKGSTIARYEPFWNDLKIVDEKTGEIYREKYENKGDADSFNHYWNLAKEQALNELKKEGKLSDKYAKGSTIIGGGNGFTYEIGGL